MPENGFNAWEPKNVFPFLEVETVSHVKDVWKVLCTFMFIMDHGNREFLLSLKFQDMFFPYKTNHRANNNHSLLRDSFISLSPTMLSKSFSLPEMSNSWLSVTRCNTWLCQGKTSFWLTLLFRITKTNVIWFDWSVFAATQRFIMLIRTLPKGRDWI